MVSGQGSTLIGAAVKRKEDPRLLTAAGTFTSGGSSPREPGNSRVCWRC